MPMEFRARAILMIDEQYVSDHNRSPLDVSYEPIETSNRTVKGNMRVYEVTKKARMSVSWENIPSRTSLTVDGYLGGHDLQAMYLEGGERRIQIWDDSTANPTVKNARMDFPGRITSFSYNVNKRNLGGVFYDFWDMSLEITEL